MLFTSHFLTSHFLLLTPLPQFFCKNLDEYPASCYHAPTMDMNVFSYYDSTTFSAQMPLACGNKVACH